MYLSLYLKGFERVTKGFTVRGSWRPNRTAIYWPPHSYGHNSVSFLFDLGCSTGGPASLGHVLIPASYLQLVWSPTAQSGVVFAPSAGCWFSLSHLFSNWLNFLCTELYKIVRRPQKSGRHKSHSFNQSTAKVIFWYSSTGCTCYLHRCISYFDSLARVNMLHYYRKQWKYFSIIWIVNCFTTWKITEVGDLSSNS